MNFRKLFFIAGMAALSMSAAAQQTFEVKLYNGRVPYDNGDTGDTAKVRVYLPNEREATGRAVVICPGGGYQNLAMEKEGYDWGEFFQNQGIAAIVLKYRMPHGNPQTPIADAEQAMKLARLNGASWKISRNDVGIMGFSAGGHLAATIATLSTGEAKPNFQILFYPVISMMEGFGHEGSQTNLLGKNPNKREQKKYSADMNVSRTTPRAFIALSDDDNTVPPANGVNYYMELYRNGVHGSLHVYPGGGHGWGSKIGFRYHEEMMMDLKAWLKSL
ncbi:alpha/beta hydrolase [Prevotella dentasini]|uniref:alpha/beta hydrolase n=1 Tax=Prevotella dentasini TaxID=589537 RepID=UPI000469DB05|nr:alpha/beta hydrolase [Prevotella dentasini]